MLKCLLDFLFKFTKKYFWFIFYSLGRTIPLVVKSFSLFYPLSRQFFLFRESKWTTDKYRCFKESKWTTDK